MSDDEILEAAEDAVRKAETKYATSNMEDFGKMIAGFFLSMVENGLHRKEAIKLTIVWLNSFMYGHGPSPITEDE